MEEMTAFGTGRSAGAPSFFGGCGAMLYVVFGELLPESILMWRSKAPAFAMLAGLLVGVVVLFV